MTTRQVTIQELDVISVGKLQAAIFAAVALLLGFFGALFVLISAIANGYLLWGLVGAMGAMALLPLTYGLAGFVTGLVGGLIYNLAAQTIGGIRLKFTYEDSSS